MDETLSCDLQCCSALTSYELCITSKVRLRLVNSWALPTPGARAAKTCYGRTTPSTLAMQGIEGKSVDGFIGLYSSLCAIMFGFFLGALGKKRRVRHCGVGVGKFTEQKPSV